MCNSSHYCPSTYISYIVSTIYKSKLLYIQFYYFFLYLEKLMIKSITKLNKSTNTNRNYEIQIKKLMIPLRFLVFLGGTSGGEYKITQHWHTRSGSFVGSRGSRRRRRCDRRLTLTPNAAVARHLRIRYS